MLLIIDAGKATHNFEGHVRISVNEEQDFIQIADTFRQVTYDTKNLDTRPNRARLIYLSLMDALKNATKENRDKIYFCLPAADFSTVYLTK